ncbi:MAG TPA: HIT family protein [Spirochaetota bacterium]|nr:HIT family protein [Spirochaetota bacterium]HNT12157.1 HIT family protein [Spirochaetota bacterium]
MSTPTCVFCDIVAGTAPARIIMENELSMVILDINPYAKGHCLVIPKRHVPWWHELTEEEVASLFALAHRAANRIMKTLAPDFVCMYARGKRIPHTHIFLIPSREGDVLDRFYNAMEKFQEAPRDLAKLAEPGTLDEARDLLT